MTNGSLSEIKFRLTDSFIEPYVTRTPPFGFNGLGHLVYLRTYSRLKEDGTNEQWHETVRRVVDGTYTMQKRWCKQNGLPWSENKAHRSAKEMYERIFAMKFLPPGRGLWAMGSALTEEKELYAALNNCGFASTENLEEDVADPFLFLMDASMLGIGVGFDTKGAKSLLVHTPIPEDADTDGMFTYQIPDTREGWVDSLKLLIESFFMEGKSDVYFDYSRIRAAGAPIKGFGGVSAGPEPLRRMHDNIRALLERRALSDNPLITSSDIVDLMNMIGHCVVAGNVRRTAEIAFGDPADVDFLDLKDPSKNPARMADATGWGYTSNNSIFAELGMDYTEAAKRVALNGEPGFAWLENMREFSRMGQPADTKDYRVMGGNPCLEQSLESYELCCLVETFATNHDSLEDYQRTLKFAYLYAKTVTLGNTPWPRTNQVMLRNRRIGLSQSGIVQAIERLGIDRFGDWCDEGYDTVQHYDRIYSDWLCIPRSIKTTSVKPSGSVSLLAGATAGMHFPQFRTYIRRMRISVHSELVAVLRKAGYPIEPAATDPDNTLVVEFPVRISDAVRTEDQVSMWEQLSLAAFLQARWADNQVSCTVTFDPETEGPQIAHALRYFQYQLKGISFLPRTPAGAYKQMPYEAISDEEYERRAKAIKPLKVKNLHEEAEAEKYCSNDGCAIE